ncbi:endonuclease III domain-containing protein [Qipengyuania sp.]|uniref:endonuclease III domain-containing protein n=1 Tax=Qipengyuania sp. TaxID=2004515 RepID=UPI0035C7F46E
MQLPLGSDPRTDVLLRLQPLLIQRFGRIERSEQGRRRPEWTLVQGVIGARTRSEVSNAATDGLLERHRSWEAVAQIELDALTTELATQTYPNMAAQRLTACLNALIALRGAADLSHLEAMETDEAMGWLEQLPGVGRKIAAGVMNASTLGRRVVVLDSHHRRILQRMGLVPARSDTARAFTAIMPAIPAEWSAAEIDEHHLLMKELGRAFCRPRALLCSSCPAQSLCETGEAMPTS